VTERSQPLAHLWQGLSGQGAPDEVDLLAEDTVADLQGQRPEPRDRNLAVRERLLAAGAALLLEGGRENLNEVLTVQRLARRAGSSRQSWHNQFADEDYLVALAEWAADPDIVRRQLEFFTQAIDAYVETQPPGVAVPGGRQLLEGLSELFRGDERYRVQLLLAAMAPDDPALLQSLVARNDFFNLHAPAVYERMFHHARFEPRPPHTYLSILVGLGALTDGYLIRSVIDPDHASPAAHAEAAVAYLAGALISVGDDRQRTLDLRGPFDAVEPSAQVGDANVTTDQIVRALVDVCAEHGTGGLALADVATRLGCSTAQLHRHYGSLAGLVWTAWSGRVLPDVRLAAEATSTPTARLRASLAVLAERCSDNYWLTSAALRLVHDAAERPSSNAPSHRDRDRASTTIARLLTDAREATRRGERGGIGDIADAQIHNLATRLELHVLLEVVAVGPPSPLDARDPGADAERIVAEVWDVCLPGLQRPRAATRARRDGGAPD
jgi:AcrR family transcriptional regulator